MTPGLGSRPFCVNLVMAEHPINAATHPNGDEGRAGSRRRGRLGRSAARLAPQPVLQKRPRYRGAGLGSHLRQQPRASNPASPVRPGLPRAPSPTPPEAPLFPGVGGSSWGSPALSGCFNPRIPWPHGQFRTSLCEKAPTPPPRPDHLVETPRDAHGPRAPARGAPVSFPAPFRSSEGQLTCPSIRLGCHRRHQGHTVPALTRVPQTR